MVDHGAFTSLLEPTQKASTTALAASTLLVHIASPAHVITTTAATAHIVSTLEVLVAPAHVTSALVVIAAAHVALVAATHLAFEGLLAFADEVVHVGSGGWREIGVQGFTTSFLSSWP